MDDLVKKISDVVEDVTYDKRQADISDAAFQQLGRMKSLVAMVDRGEVDANRVVELLRDHYERFSRDMNTAGK